MGKYALGLDFGTNSCRSLIVDLADGREVATYVFDYPSGEAGILLDDKDPNCARQDPQDYLDALEGCVRESITVARDNVAGFDHIVISDRCADLPSQTFMKFVGVIKRFFG